MLLLALYSTPPRSTPLHSTTREQFEDFFEEVFQELSKFGEIAEMNVCDNLGDHLIGNVYVKVSETSVVGTIFRGTLCTVFA